MLINACFSALNYTEGLMSVEQSIKSKTLKLITFENNVIIMLDHSGNRSNTCHMGKTEPSVQIFPSILMPVAINTPQ